MLPRHARFSTANDAKSPTNRERNRVNARQASPRIFRVMTHFTPTIHNKIVTSRLRNAAFAHKITDMSHVMKQERLIPFIYCVIGRKTIIHEITNLYIWIYFYFNLLMSLYLILHKLNLFNFTSIKFI